jgi:hypothetical protein
MERRYSPKSCPPETSMFKNRKKEPGSMRIKASEESVKGMST